MRISIRTRVSVKSNCILVSGLRRLLVKKTATGDRASLTGFKKADNTEENTERLWRWERDRTLARQYSSRPINSSA